MKKILFILIMTFCLIYPSFAYVETINGTGEDYSHENKLFDEPVDMDISDGTLYVSDAGKGVVYKMEGNEIERKVGIDLIERPSGIKIVNDTWYMCDEGENTIYIFDYSTDVDQMAFEWEPRITPAGIDIYGKKAYVADNYANRIVVYNLTELRAIEYIGSEGAYDLEFNEPSDLEIHNGEIYVADQYNHRIQVLTVGGEFVTHIGTGFGNFTLKYPTGVSVNERGYVFVVEDEGRVSVFDSTGYPIEHFGSEGSGNYEFDEPQGILARGDKVYVADTENHRIQIYTFTDDRENPELEQRIHVISEEVEYITLLVSKASEIGLEYFVPVESYYLSAENSLDEKRYSEAEQYTEQAEEWLENNVDAIESEVSSMLNFKIEEMKTAINYYNSVGVDTSEIASHVTDAEIALEDKSYIEAVDDYLNAKDAEENLETGEEYNYTTINTTQDRLEETNQSINSLKNLAQSYQKQVETSDVESLLSIAESYINSGNTYMGNEILDEIEETIEERRSSLEDEIIAIDGALANISYYEEQLMEIEEGTLIPIDFSEEKNKINQAYTLAYSSPEEAVDLAQEAVEEAKSTSSLQLNLIIGAFLIIVFVVIAAGSAVYVVGKMLKKKRSKK